MAGALSKLQLIVDKSLGEVKIDAVGRFCVSSRFPLDTCGKLLDFPTKWPISGNGYVTKISKLKMLVVTYFDETKISF